MKTTILKFAIILLVFIISFTSCKQPFLFVNETPIEVPISGGEYAIKVESNAEWSATFADAQNCNWCTLSNNTGIGNGTVKVLVAENTSNLKRSVVIKVISNELMRSILITQDLTDEPEFPCEWDYPIKPGTTEWNELPNRAARVAACQIPEDVLNCISTADLTEICLQYPFLFEATNLHECLEYGFNRFFFEFNGIRELFNREKALNEILKHYKTLINDITILDEGYNFDFINSIEFSELFLCGYVQRIELPVENYKNILRSLVVGYEKELIYSDDYFKWITCNFFARAHVIFKINQNLASVIPSYMLLCGPILNTPQSAVDIINQLSYQLLGE